jgi:hypothetical protein
VTNQKEHLQSLEIFTNLLFYSSYAQTLTLKEEKIISPLWSRCCHSGPAQFNPAMERVQLE